MKNIQRKLAYLIFTISTIHNTQGAHLNQEEIETPTSTESVIQDWYLSKDTVTQIIQESESPLKGMKDLVHIITAFLECDQENVVDYLKNSDEPIISGIIFNFQQKEKPKEVKKAFQRKKFKHCQFTGTFKTCLFGRSKLEKINFSGADLTHTSFWRARLVNINLTNADLAGVILSQVDLTGVNLTAADLFRADLRRANLTTANLFGATLKEANLKRTGLAGADLTGANLRRADLTDADMTDARLTGTILTGAKFSKKSARSTGMTQEELTARGAMITEEDSAGDED